MQLIEIQGGTDRHQVAPHKCQELLHHIAAWAIADHAVALLLPSASTAQLRRVRSQLNRDEVRVAMLVLGHDALLKGYEAREKFSIRRLSRVLDGARAESMQRTLRNWMLPVLCEVGWIEGIRANDVESVSTHAIAITPKGLMAVHCYLEKLS